MGPHLDKRELAFIAQEEVFQTRALQMIGVEKLEDLPDPTERNPVPLPPVVLEDYRALISSAFLPCLQPIGVNTQSPISLC